MNINILHNAIENRLVGKEKVYIDGRRYILSVDAKEIRLGTRVFLGMSIRLFDPETGHVAEDVVMARSVDDAKTALRRFIEDANHIAKSIE